MSKLVHICFTLIIYKQFNFCRFRASAYTKVDRLCAVFLYNHNYIQECGIPGGRNDVYGVSNYIVIKHDCYFAR